MGMVAIGSGLSCLQFLDISYCRKLSDKGVSAITEGCYDLRTLHLAGCRFVTDRVLHALSENCPKLEELCLQGCTNITDSGLTVLANGCRGMKHLDVNKCSNLGDGGISTVAETCSDSLKALKCLDCYKVGDEAVLSLAKFCTNLETLIIGGCRDISDESVRSLAYAACNHTLKRLRMDWCTNISDSSVKCILSQCTNLEALDIGCCEEVKDAAFHGLDGKLGLRLRILKVSNCSQITVAGIGLLLELCSSLEYLDVRSCPHITEALCNEFGLQFPSCCRVNFSGSLSEPDVFVGDRLGLRSV